MRMGETGIGNLSGRGWASRGRSRAAAVSSMHHAVFGFDEQLVEDQGIGLFVQTPENQQHDGFEMLQRQRLHAGGQRALDGEFAQMRLEHPGAFEKVEIADGFQPQAVELLLRVKTNGVCALLVLGLEAAYGAVEPAKPVDGFVDFVALEPGRAEFARELPELGAGFRMPVGLVEIHENIEHEAILCMTR